MLSFGNTIKTAIARIEQRIARVNDLTPVMSGIAKHMVRNSIPETFASAGRGTWLPVNRYGYQGAQPLVDRGNLLRGIKPLLVDRQTAIISTGADSIQAALMHFGGVVVPRNNRFMAYGGPFMAVPVTLRAARMGVSAYLAQKGAFIVGTKSKRDRPGIYRRTGSGVEMGFRFSRSEYIPPRPYMVIWPDDREVFVELGRSHIMLGKAG